MKKVDRSKVSSGSGLTVDMTKTEAMKFKRRDRTTDILYLARSPIIYVNRLA